MGSYLLANHENTSDQDSLQHVGGEHELPHAKPAILSLELDLGLLVEHDSGLNLKELGAQKRVVLLKSAEASESVNALIVAMLHHQPTGREWKEEHSKEQDPGG